jgi:ABC-type branched-subunit amino acid transport system substrate-binding protein
MDTVRWSQPTNPKPPIRNEPGRPADPAGQGSGSSYHIAYLLPFLSAQSEGGSVPDKSRLALQFYAGAKIALEQISKEERINLVADVYDTQANDADFQKLMNNPRLEQASVFIGPVRSSHVQAFAEWAKQRRKILLSPEAPNADLTRENPDFIQFNPSLRAHCEAIARFVRKRHRAEAVTLVCKEKEADRLPYFQNANAALGGSRMAELVLPDAATNFDKTDLKPYLKPGRTAVFVLPVWASQDFVMAFLRKLRNVKGNVAVEVYGMPQWRQFESIEPEYWQALNVHISAASYVDYGAQEVRDFQQRFYEATGTIPDEDGFNGYDITLFCGRMLARHGLSFPERLAGAAPYKNLHGWFGFAAAYGASSSGELRYKADYQENTYLHILRFDKTGFVPVGP